MLTQATCLFSVDGAEPIAGMLSAGNAPDRVQISGVCAQISALPGDFAGKVKARAWISRLHQMSAAQELTPDDIRQLLFDLESSYNDFMQQLPNLS